MFRQTGRDSHPDQTKALNGRATELLIAVLVSLRRARSRYGNNLVVIRDPSWSAATATTGPPSAPWRYARRDRTSLLSRMTMVPRRPSPAKSGLTVVPGMCS